MTLGPAERRAALIDVLPPKLQAIVDGHLSSIEQSEVRLKAAFAEVLVCTDQRVLILKSGFMAGQLLGGSKVFQSPYASISGVEIDFRRATGHLEISSGGMQNTPKSYFGKGRESAALAPNCVCIAGKQNLPRFQEAATFILARAQGMRRSQMPIPSEDDILEKLERLVSLKDRGALTDDEFAAQKARLLQS